MSCLLLLLIPVVDVFLFAWYCRARGIQNGHETGAALLAVYVLMWLFLPVYLSNGLLRGDVEWMAKFLFDDHTAYNIAVSPILSFIAQFPLFALLSFYPVKRLTGRSFPESLWLCVLFYLPLALIPIAETLA